LDLLQFVTVLVSAYRTGDGLVKEHGSAVWLFHSSNISQSTLLNSSPHHRESVFMVDKTTWWIKINTGQKM